MVALSDEQLMQDYLAGSTAAFDVLYARYRGPLYRYIVRLCADCPEAEELFQDVWLRLVRSGSQWNPDQRFKPWLFRIAHNRVVDHWRSFRGDVSDELDNDQPEPLHKPWPDALLLLRDCVQRLMALIAHLPEVQRSAFLLKEEAGLSLLQIAEVTGVERETVKSRLRYALRRLRGGLEDCDD